MTDRRSSRPSVEAITSTRALSPLSSGSLRRRPCRTRLRDRLWDGGLLFALISGRWRPPSEPNAQPARRRPPPATAPNRHRAGPPFEARRPERWVPTMPQSERRSRIGARAVDHSSLLTTAYWSASPRSEPRLTEPSARCQARRTARHPRPRAAAPAPWRAVWWLPGDRSCRAAPCSGRYEQSLAPRSSPWHSR